MFGYEVKDGISIEEQFHGKESAFSMEVRLAKEFVLKSDKPRSERVQCPVCQSSACEFFFEKWGLEYFLCPDCWTIAAPSVKEEVRAFEKRSPLTKLRASPRYQRIALEKRAASWNSLLDWIRYRLYRFNGKVDGRRALLRGIRYKGLYELFKQDALFETVDVKGSIILDDHYEHHGYDTLFFLDTIQRRTSPLRYLQQACDMLEPGGVLFLTTRIGSGFDVLTLKGKSETIFPYEHIFLPSVRGLGILLEKAGFEVLETSTPGMFDTAHVFRYREMLPKDSYFARYLTAEFNQRLFADFQKLLQKHGLSSTVRILAVKR